MNGGKTRNSPSRMERHWQQFARMAPADGMEDIKSLARAAFYAGAASVLTEIVPESDVPGSIDRKAVKEITIEILAFMEVSK